jgi:hypothetical protein
MKTAGADLNETLALLTGIAEITQSPEEAGNFLKTASMRLRGKHTCLHMRKGHMPCCA